LRDACAPLPEDDRHLEIPLAQLVVPGSQLPELPAAIGSPHPTVKDEQQAAPIGE
jgi:hypothetical protein